MDRACATPSVQLSFKVKDHIVLTTHVDAVNFSLHYTAEGSSETNDMVLRTAPAVDPREERVPGFRIKYLADDVPPERVARISCTLGLPHGSGYVQLESGDPKVQPTFNYCYLQHPNDIRRAREGLRLGLRLLESDGRARRKRRRCGNQSDEVLARIDVCVIHPAIVSRDSCRAVHLHAGPIGQAFEHGDLRVRHRLAEFVDDATADAAFAPDEDLGRQ